MNRKKNKKWSIVILITLFIIPSLYFAGIYFFYKRPRQALWFKLIFNNTENYSKSIKNNKIIFSGGSNTLFGIRTQLIEQIFRVPSVNLGVTAALKIDYIIHVTKRNVQKGDVVILPLEYIHYHYSNQKYSATRSEYIRTYDVPFFRSQSIVHQIRDIKKTSPLDLLRSINEQLEFKKKKQKIIKNVGKIVKNNFNKNGDAINNNKPAKKILEHRFKAADDPGNFKETDGLKLLKDFNNWCKKNKIHFYITYPNLLYNEKYRNKRFRRYFKSLNHYFQINKIAVIGSPYDFMYERKLFWDTKYHLTYDGVTMRTMQFIELMKKHKIPELIKK